jgi:hypothetical protein
MKENLKIHLLLLFLLCFPTLMRGQGTAFTYQGRLNDGGTPVNGIYDLTFSLFDSDSAGNQVGNTITNAAVGVSNGLFVTTLDFGSGVFDGTGRWLEIGVSTNADDNFATLSPRQEVTATPYAIYAATAASAASVAAGSVASDQLSTPAGPLDGQVLAYTGGSLSWIDPTVVSGSIWSLNGANAYYNAGGVGIGTTTPFSKLGVRTGTGLYGFTHTDGTTTLGSYIGNSGSGASGGWFGTVSTHPLHLFVGGGQPSLTIDTTGDVGIGTFAPQAGVRLEVNGTTRLTAGGSGGEVRFHTPAGESGMSIIGANRADVRFDGSSLKLIAGLGAGAAPSDNGITIDTLGAVGVGKSINFGSTPRQMLNMFGIGFGVGVQTGNLYYRSGGGYAWHIGGVHNDANYNSGGGTTVATLDLTTGLDFGSRLGQHISLWGGVSSRRFDIGIQASTIYFRTGNGAGDAFAWYKGGAHNDGVRSAGGGQTLMTLDGETGLNVSGPASVCTLTIRGGCDLAEPFKMKEEALEKGSVVVIDQEHPGQLKRSVQAYDKRVAGIVSGANGINYGISLHQEGMLEGGENVALSGRVYVLADAGNGEIEPGDLLTTSDIPGYAMKVTDPAKAQGAVLGKAMSGLAKGHGTVLVLVTLQ